MAGSSVGAAKTVMVAVDESEESMYALQWALDNLLTQNNDQHIIVMHAEVPASSKVGLGGQAVASSGHRVLKIAERSENLITQRVLARAREISDKRNVTVDFKVMVGEARYAICEAANKMGVDVLVVGSHGHGAVKRAVAGSVTEHCTRHCKCRVLVIKKPHH
uniref:UspA domain-containing protein n=1 Tax=Araucaria cunninghamii TaxID=56994 RepID=A0A0D6QZ76_ARACU